MLTTAESTRILHPARIFTAGSRGLANSRRRQIYLHLFFLFFFIGSRFLNIIFLFLGSLARVSGASLSSSWEKGNDFFFLCRSCGHLSN